MSHLQNTLNAYILRTSQPPDFLRDIVREHVLGTELYDRTVCTGPIKYGCIMPIGYHELGLINRNANASLTRLNQRADYALIPRAEVRRERMRYDGSPAYHRDLEELLYDYSCHVGCPGAGDKTASVR